MKWLETPEASLHKDHFVLWTHIFMDPNSGVVVQKRLRTTALGSPFVSSPSRSIANGLNARETFRNEATLKIFSENTGEG